MPDINHKKEYFCKNCGKSLGFFNFDYERTLTKSFCSGVCMDEYTVGYLYDNVGNEETSDRFAS
jgi:hypothetical protein